MSELKPNFTILVDERRREVHYTVSGFWSGDDMTRFQSALLQKGKPLYGAPGGFNVLGDMSGLAVQDRTMATSMQFLIQEAAKLGMKRQAFVITSSLLKLQFERLLGETNTQLFSNRGDAIAWLRGA